jgi:hypothetical protein
MSAFVNNRNDHSPVVFLGLRRGRGRYLFDHCQRQAFPVRQLRQGSRATE